MEGAFGDYSQTKGRGGSGSYVSHPKVIDGFDAALAIGKEDNRTVGIWLVHFKS